MTRFFGLLLSPIACGSTPAPVHHAPAPTESVTTGILYTPPADGPCGPLTSFNPRETLLQVIHGQNVDYTLTDRTLYVWRLVSESVSADGKETVAKSQCSQHDVREIVQRGLIDWQLVNDVCYFFTKDQRLIALPHGDPKQRINYLLEFETARLSKHRISYFAGMVFFAPIAETVTVLSFVPEVRTAWLEVDARNPRAQFSQVNDRLYFGVQGGVMTELVVAGKTAASVSAIEVR